MIRTPISDLGCEQAPAGCEVEKNDDFASISSGSAGGKDEEWYCKYTKRYQLDVFKTLSFLTC